MTQTLVEMATVFVVARMRAGPCPPDVIQHMLHTTHATLCDLLRQEITQKRKRQENATPPETLAALRQRPWEALQRSQVICLECGQAHRLLSGPTTPPNRMSLVWGRFFSPMKKDRL
jgi:predicted transcriptional regulator